jgi:hypothetical protein
MAPGAAQASGIAPGFMALNPLARGQIGAIYSRINLAKKST